MYLDFNLPGISSDVGGDDVFLAGNRWSVEYVLMSLIRRHIMSFCPNIGDVSFDFLVKVV